MSNIIICIVGIIIFPTIFYTIMSIAPFYVTYIIWFPYAIILGSTIANLFINIQIFFRMKKLNKITVNS